MDGIEQGSTLTKEKTNNSTKSLENTIMAAYQKVFSLQNPF